MLKPDEDKDGDTISATSPQNTLQIESQHTVSYVYVLSLPGPHRLRPRGQLSTFVETVTVMEPQFDKITNPVHTATGRKKKSPHVT